MGTGQAAYHCSRIQAAARWTRSIPQRPAKQFDADVVWYSVAKTTADGYVVEVQIPLQSLRFTGGDSVRWDGVLP